MLKKTFAWMTGAVCVVGAAVGLAWEAGLLGAPRRPQVIQSGQNFSIPVSKVKEIPQFYPLEVDGTKMEIIVVKDSAGNVRTAFNTCQSCYASGRGYYEVEGNKLVCQNCGAQFTAEQVEARAGGCNPFPIFAENKFVKDGTIQIPYEYLSKSTGLFAGWER